LDGRDLIHSRTLDASPVESVIRSAARRRFAVLTLEQLAFALLPVLSGTVILLLVGTQILHWYWLAMLAVAGLVISSVRIRARNLSHYQTAQQLDRRLQLDDTLSTAWFLLETPHRREDGIASFQLRQAENIAAGIESARAFPLAWRRVWTLTVALAAVAFGLFAIRYLVTRSLSLERALIPIQIAPVFERLESRLFPGNQLSGNPGGPGRTQQKADSSAGKLPDQKTADVPNGQAEENGKPTDYGSKASVGDQADSSKNGENRDRDSGATNAQSEGKQADQLAGNQTSKQDTDPKQQANSGQQAAQGLMDKMKDALSNLMAKMRQNSTQQAQQNSRTSNEDKAGSQNSGKPQQSQQDAQNQQASQDQSSESQAQAQATERTQASQGRSSDALPEKGADAHSGIGRQDGDKDVKEAEQLQAMGKLAEIIGKRSANVTGDMMVETPSGKQQLKTAYTQKLGRHSDSGGEINRDEIPLADQQYVREYMELVRKQGKTAQ
jgi:hypothetical protein